ncbi:primary amine oxidase- lung isozyme [Apiospora phragmitis]|uniref:Amine oxidase n=1 Tax=Apiospora phragmitis TaxID=2905665 RepID=A0ABR1VDS9_9PEZI
MCILIPPDLNPMVWIFRLVRPLLFSELSTASSTQGKCYPRSFTLPFWASIAPPLLLDLLGLGWRTEGLRADSPRSTKQHLNVLRWLPEVSAPKENVWAPISSSDTAAVIEWLVQQSELNLTAPTVTGINGTWQNSVILVEAMMPNKTDVLPYLDGSAPAPERCAHVLLSNRASETPTYQDILVGPLPLDNATAKYFPLEFRFTRKTEGKVRNLDADGPVATAEWLNPIGRSIEDIAMDLWGGTLSGYANDTMRLGSTDPVWQGEDGTVKRWYGVSRKPSSMFDTGSIMSAGLYVKSDVTGRDPSKWKLEGWYYNGVFYKTTEAFRTAYFSPGFEKIGREADGPWAWTERQVDVERQYVEWMDFSFYLGFTRDTGLAFYDVKYKGERIMYELGLQEALAHYAGSDPWSSHIAYLDSYYGFGTNTYELVKGYDCPQYATYLNSSYYAREQTHTHTDSICLFEFDADGPIQRHTTNGWVTVSKNVAFVVRAVATVGNYDYTFSYTFALDGSVAVDVRASGYISGAFEAQNGGFGYQIHKGLNGAMHDHVLNFKADLDVLGTANSVLITKNKPISRTYPWSDGEVVNTMELERTYISNEDEGRFNWEPNGQGQVVVINKDQKNQQGEYRGWRVLPSTRGSHLSIINSTIMRNTAHFAEYDVSISRAKDSEPRATHPYGNQDTRDPPVDFAKFFDGESLEQEDIVLWVNLGMHHIPHTGDLPNTVMTAAQAGIKFVPSNYFDGDQSIRSRSQVRINYNTGKVSSLTKAGRDPICESTLMAYAGDSVINKYPYDPTNVFYDMAGLH